MQDSSSTSSSKQICVNFNLENLCSDFGLREKISSYHFNNHDEIRGFYLQQGPCQSVLHKFSPTNFFGKPCRFNFDWYVSRNWLEYSIDKDTVFCLYCYLFGKDVGKQEGGETFVTKGFKHWNQI